MQESLAVGEASRWGQAVGNIEDARVALDTLARAIEDAVYLDEDAYHQVAPVMQYQRASQVLHHSCVFALVCYNIIMLLYDQVHHDTDIPVIAQVQQQRMTELTLELQETNHKLDQCCAQKDAADQRIAEMAQELENSAGDSYSDGSCCIGIHAVTHGFTPLWYPSQWYIQYLFGRG